MPVRVLYFGLEYLIWLYVALKATSAFKWNNILYLNQLIKKNQAVYSNPSLVLPLTLCQTNLILYWDL